MAPAAWIALRHVLQGAVAAVDEDFGAAASVLAGRSAGTTGTTAPRHAPQGAIAAVDEDLTVPEALVRRWLQGARALLRHCRSRHGRLR